MIEGTAGFVTMNWALFSGLIALIGLMNHEVVERHMLTPHFIINGFVFLVMIPLAILS